MYIDAYDLITKERYLLKDPDIFRVDNVSSVSEVDDDNKEVYKTSSYINYGFIKQNTIDNIVDLTSMRKEYIWGPDKKKDGLWFSIMAEIESSDVSILINIANKLFSSIIRYDTECIVFETCYHKALNSVSPALRYLSEHGGRFTTVTVRFFDEYKQLLHEKKFDQIDDVTEVISYIGENKYGAFLDEKKIDSDEGASYGRRYGLDSSQYSGFKLKRTSLSSKVKSGLLTNQGLTSVSELLKTNKNEVKEYTGFNQSQFKEIERYIKLIATVSDRDLEKSLSKITSIKEKSQLGEMVSAIKKGKMKTVYKLFSYFPQDFSEFKPDILIKWVALNDGEIDEIYRLEDVKLARIHDGKRFLKEELLKLFFSEDSGENKHSKERVYKETSVVEPAVADKDLNTVEAMDSDTDNNKAKKPVIKVKENYTGEKLVEKDVSQQQIISRTVVLVEADSLTQMDKKFKEVSHNGNIEFWGDIELSSSGVEILKNRISVVLESGYTLTELFKNYPYALVSYAVFYSKYNYNGDFWGMLSEGLGIDKLSQFEQIQIRKQILSVFDKCKLDYSAALDSSRKYVNSVLYELGEPPVSNFGDVFYLFKYGMMANVDPQVLIDEITSRAFNVHKPLLHFLEKAPEGRTITFVLDIQDTYLLATQADDMSGKYASAYSDWYELDKEKTTYRSKKDDEQVEVRPYFVFDNGKKGLCIVLPRQNMAEEWVEGAKWIIAGDNDYRVIKECLVQGSEGKRFTDQITVSVKPCESYTLTFEYDDGFETHPTPYDLKGIGNNDYLYFSSNGRRINQRYLKSPFGIIIYPSGASVEANNVERDIQSYPLISSDYRVEQIIPTDIDSEYVIGTDAENIVFQMRPEITVGLSGKKLFGTEYIESEIPIFVEIPTLDMSFQGFSNAEGIEIHIGKDSLVVDNLDVDEETSVDISAGFDDGDYGIKTVRIYQFNRFLKQIRFCLLPEFKTNYDSELVWPKGNLKTTMAKVTVKKIDGWEISFSNGTTQDLVDKYVVSVPFSEGALVGTIVSKLESLHMSVDFELPISAYKTELISENEITERCDLTDFLEGKVWSSISFYGDYREYEYTAELISVNGIEQKKQLKLSSSGAVNLDMNVFRDTVQTVPLPVKITVLNDETDEKFDLLVIEEVSKFKRRPGYAAKSQSVGIWAEDITGDVVVEKYGNPSFSLQLKYEESKLNEKGWRVFKLDEEDALTPGYYRVVRESAIDDLFSLDEEFSLTMDTDQFFVSEKVKNEAISSFKIWLEQIISELIKCRSVKNLQALRQSESYMARNHLLSYIDLDIDDDAVSYLVILAQMLEGKLSNAHKNIICGLMTLISRTVLTNQDRYRIIKELVDLKVDDYVFGWCVKNYALMLFEYPHDEKKMDIRDVISGVKVTSSRLALLMLMKLDTAIRDTLGNATFRDIIGQEAIVEMLQSAGTDEEQTEDRKLFLREDERNRVHVRLTKAISGENRFYEMIDEERSRKDRIYLDKKKIPDEGIYLNGTRYTDLFVNWYIRNHLGGGDLDPQLKKAMLESFERFKKVVWLRLISLKRMENWGRYLSEYDSVLMNRTAGESMGFSLPNYFYFVALAALITRMDVPGEYGNIKDEANIFMINAFEWASYIAERDMIMASLFLYLRKKED